MRLIDISSNNPHPINWAAVRAAGIDGVMVKATEGITYVSPTFGSDYTAARAAGLRAGAYHFWHPELDLNTQLNWFRLHYGPAAGDLPPWWDAEINPSGLSWGALAGQLKAAVWCCAVAYGSALIYLNRSWAAALGPQGFTPDQLVIAQGAAGPLERAAAMQFSPVPIPGIAGLTDWSST